MGNREMTMRPRVIPQRGINLDYMMWLFTRISGLFLVLLSLVGFFYAMMLGARTQIDLGTLMRYTFFPNPNHVVNYVNDVEAGWMNAFTQIFQMAIVFLGVSHGFNGLRMVLEDYVDQGWRQLMLRGTIFLVWLFVFLIAIQVILAN